MPEINETAIRAKAYVVGPIMRARRRVHVTSYTSAANPDRAAAVIATTGAAAMLRGLTGAARRARRAGRGLRDLSRCTRAIHSAPHAAAMLSAIATHVVPRMPNVGISQKPAAIAPAAAPAVLEV